MLVGGFTVLENGRKNGRARGDLHRDHSSVSHQDARIGSGQLRIARS